MGFLAESFFPWADWFGIGFDGGDFLFPLFPLTDDFIFNLLVWSWVVSARADDDSVCVVTE